MKREILFRGQATLSGPAQNKGDWVFGYLAAPFSIYTPSTDPIKEGHYFVDPATIGQFTGLKDSEGNKIFEGDILGGHPHGTAWVEWDEAGCWSACWQEPDEEPIKVSSLLHNELNDCSPEWKIIGNIHENKELLK